MTPEQKQLLSERIETGLLFLWGFTFLLFPIFYLTYTTDAFILPKSLLVAIITLASLILWATQAFLHSSVRIKRTPLDVPIILFVVAVFLSAIFSANKTDSLAAAVTVLFAGLSYFVLTNVFRNRKVTLFLLSSLLTGGVLATIITAFAHFRVYVLPFVSSRTPTFTPLGTYVEFALIIAMLVPATFTFLLPAMKGELSSRVGVFAVCLLALVAGLVLAVSGLLTSQKPLLLPFDTGFQTAFAAISQDSGRIFQTFLFGEGYGNFATVFTRFHSASFNSNQQLWFLSFNNSSSYLLELLATTGLVGVLSYLFLCYKALVPIAKKRTNPFYLSLVVAFALSALLPFSAIEVFFLFFLLAVATIAEREINPDDFFDTELKFVALKKGVFSFTTLDEGQGGRIDRHPTPIVASVVILVVVLVLGYFTTIYTLSDMMLQQSLVSANANNGTSAYRLQTQAISTYPYRSDYYRIFSQTNIALANSLLSLNSGHASPSAQAQQTAYTLIQQAITTAHQATTLAPQSAVAWQNLSSVYRALIGVGQNAQDFAISSAQQATTLDSVNPQEYLNLGGLYYQLGQYDNAVQMFQQAISLKADYANAYYNLGHAYEQQGNLSTALTQLQTVQSLIGNNPANLSKIDSEIAALQTQIKNKGASAAPTSTQGANGQQPLALPTGSTQLPSQPSQVPLISPTPTSRK